MKKLLQYYRKNNYEIVILVGIIIVAFGLRIWGIKFGLPYEYHVDEVQYVRQAAQMGSTGLNPVWWNNPPFLKYIFLIEDIGLFIFGRVLGWYTSVADFGTKLSVDPTHLYIFGRGTSAIMGTLTILVTYFIGAKAYNRRVGLIAAFLLSICFLPVRESHFAVNDTAVTLWISVVLLAAIQISKTRKILWYVIGGAALGLGFATKYSALIAIIPLTLSLLIILPGSSRKDSFLKIAVTFILTAILASPYFVISARKVWADAYEALFLAGKYGFEGWQIDRAGGYIFYLKTLIWGMGWGLLVLCMLGIIYGIIKHRPTDLIILSLPIVGYLTIGAQEMYFARFLLPFIPAFIILGASVSDSVLTYIKRFSLSSVILILLGIIILVIQPLLNSIRLDYVLSQPDTRTLAKEWIENNIPPGSKIAQDWHYHGVPLSTLENPVASSKEQYVVTYMDGKGLSDHSISWYQSEGYQYLITSSNITNIPLVDPIKNESRNNFYRSLDHNLELIHVVQPVSGNKITDFIFDEIYSPAISIWQRERPGPVIKVFAIK